MDNKNIDTWYEQQCSSVGMESGKTPRAKKLLAFTLMMALPAATTGCSSNAASADAYSECQWEKEKYGYEYDCDDDTSSSSWYSTHGYSSKKSAIKAGTAYYKAKGFGSGGTSKGSWSGG
ncbi:hypothetical protein SY83_08550 [Paenibacillus swuensis]|uniref:Uncharacterized protein n=1 Tax=Paenibacillus swuensis TaxID=1178515 RepID=A0A172TGY9_9BACL|nr:hypothetical protein [Paenibacillus swuensis]ANE46319.1 hypothetical protein SY83_08550 [Paenibacillus swuensis]